MTDSPAAKGMLAFAALALLLPVMMTAQDVFNSPYVVTGETGTVHIHLTPEMTRQLMAQQGPVLAPGVLSYHGGPIMTGVSLPWYCQQQHAVLLHQVRYQHLLRWHRWIGWLGGRY
jgi:hypothetical protein